MPNQTNSNEKSCQESKSKLLILGSEGQGLAPSIMKKCHRFESIQPGRKLHHCVDSLNVSVATALLINKLL